MSRADALVALTAKPGGTALQLCAPAVGIVRGVPEQGRILGSGHVFGALTILDRSHPLLVPEGIAGIVEKVDLDGCGADAIPVQYAQPIITLGPIDVGAADRTGSAGIHPLAHTPASRGAGSSRHDDAGHLTSGSTEDEDTGPIPARGARTSPSTTPSSSAHGRQAHTSRADSTGETGPRLSTATGGGATAERIAGRSADAIPEGCHAVVCPADGIFYRRPRPGDPAYVEVGSEVRAGQTLGLIEAMKTFSPIPYGGPGLPSPARIVEIRADDSQEVRHGQVIFIVR